MMPGVCRDCRAQLVWTGLHWAEPDVAGVRRHICHKPVTVDEMFDEMARNDPEFRSWREAEARVALA